jgi:hypothetical protein
MSEVVDPYLLLCAKFVAIGGALISLSGLAVAYGPSHLHGHSALSFAVGLGLVLGPLFAEPVRDM